MHLIAKYSDLFDNAFHLDKAIILNPVRQDGITSANSAKISHYTLGQEIDVEIGQRHRREATLVITTANDVQGEIQISTALANKPLLGDDKVLRIGEFDYNIRFDLNASSSEPALFLIAEKRSARAKVV